MTLTKSEFNRNFLIIYFPKRGVTWNSKLIGLDKMKAIINDNKIWSSQYRRIEELM